jgi:hypothetical protein
MFADQGQDQGIKVGSGTSRDDRDQHENIENFWQIEPIVDPIRFIDRLAESDPLRSRRGDGDEADEKQTKRGQRCEKPDNDSEPGGELDCRAPSTLVVPRRRRSPWQDHFTAAWPMSSGAVNDGS